MKTLVRTDWDAHLVARAQAGEVVAFELLADSHREAMRQLALRMLRNPDDANDAVQDALLKAFRAIRSFHNGRPVQPWFLRIVANCCVDTIRTRRHDCEPLEPHEFALVDPRVRVAEEAEDAMLDEEIRGAIERLPNPYRRIIQMRHFGHMEVGEIADLLNKPEGTIKSWLFRARALLRKELSPAVV